MKKSIFFMFLCFFAISGDAFCMEKIVGKKRKRDENGIKDDRNKRTKCYNKTTKMTINCYIKNRSFLVAGIDPDELDETKKEKYKEFLLDLVRDIDKGNVNSLRETINSTNFGDYTLSKLINAYVGETRKSTHVGKRLLLKYAIEKLEKSNFSARRKQEIVQTLSDAGANEFLPQSQDNYISLSQMTSERGRPLQMLYGNIIQLPEYKQDPRRNTDFSGLTPLHVARRLFLPVE